MRWDRILFISAEFGLRFSNAGLMDRSISCHLRFYTRSSRLDWVSLSTLYPPRPTNSLGPINVHPCHWCLSCFSGWKGGNAKDQEHDLSAWINHPSSCSRKHDSDPGTISYRASCTTRSKFNSTKCETHDLGSTATCAFHCTNSWCENDYFWLVTARHLRCCMRRIIDTLSILLILFPYFQLLSEIETDRIDLMERSAVFVNGLTLLGRKRGLAVTHTGWIIFWHHRLHFKKF